MAKLREGDIVECTCSKYGKAPVEGVVPFECPGCGKGWKVGDNCEGRLVALPDKWGVDT